MSSTVVPMENSEHVAVQSLLPWYVRGKLSGSDLQAVESHLLHCAECRRELEAEQPLQQWLRVAGAPAPSGPSADASLARLRHRLIRPPAPARAPRWMPWALGLQGAALALLLGVMVVQPQNEVPAYQGLASGPAAPAADAIFMVKPGVTELAMRELLQANKARIVAGPTETGAYLLQVDAKGLRALRASTLVAMAEPLQMGSK